MFRITAHINSGHDMSEVTFHIKAQRLDLALLSAIKALSQLGFKDLDYYLTHSRNLND